MRRRAGSVPARAKMIALPDGLGYLDPVVTDGATREVKRVHKHRLDGSFIEVATLADWEAA